MDSPAPFDIYTDWSRKIIRMTIRGYWDDVTVAEFGRQLEKAEAHLGAGGQRFGYLCDARALDVQSREVGEHWRVFLERRNPRGLRTAIVVSGTLSKIQVARVSATGTRRVFTAMADALAWLASSEAPESGAA